MRICVQQRVPRLGSCGGSLSPLPTNADWSASAYSLTSVIVLGEELCQVTDEAAAQLAYWPPQATTAMHEVQVLQTGGAYRCQLLGFACQLWTSQKNCSLSSSQTAPVCHPAWSCRRRGEMTGLVLSSLADDSWLHLDLAGCSKLYGAELLAAAPRMPRLKALDLTGVICYDVMALDSASSREQQQCTHL